MPMQGGVRTRGPERRLLPPAFLIVLVILLAGATVLRAQDEGTTGAPAGEGLPPPEWSEVMPLAAKGLTLAVDKAGEALVAVGERGHVLRSLDGGATWRQIRVPTRSTLTAVSFADPRHGWAVGHQATMLQTSDGGLNWVRVDTGLDPRESFLSVLALSPDRVLAGAAYGMLLTSEDGGASWHHDIVSAEELHLNALVRGPTGLLYIAGERGELLVSTDEGARWEPLTRPYDGSFYGLLALTDRLLVAYGLRGHVFRSVDGGESWETLDVGTEVLLHASGRLADGRVLIAGMGGTVLLGDATARRFTLTRFHDLGGITDLVPLGNSRAFLAVGTDGTTRLNVASLNWSPPTPSTP